MSSFEKVANEIRQRIIDNVYPVNELLPNQEKLSKIYGVSRMTIQKSLNLLKLEGFVETKRGVGTFAKQPPIQEDIYNSHIETVVGTTKQFSKIGVLSSQVLSFEPRFPIEEEMKQLKIRSDHAVYDIIRLRFLDGVPFHLEYSVMPIHVIPAVTHEVLSHSIYSHITKNLKLEIGSAVRIIRADKPDGYDKKYLNCKEDDPILEIEQVVYLKDGTPFEYSQTRCRYDKGNITYISYKF